MKIGFLISVVGIFGSVREVIENANVFVKEGHQVFIFNPEREDIAWIDCKAKLLYENRIYDHDLDILILTTEPTDHYFKLFNSAKARIKIFCMMGFDQTRDFLTSYTNLNYILDNYYVTADGSWQLDWFRKNTTCKRILNNQIGGVNTTMFQPVESEQRKHVVIGWSGDPRERKGGELLSRYFEAKNIKTETYWKKGIPQDSLKIWFSTIDIFIDNHNRGGWCNPVAEAMACGKLVICSETECNQSFAINNTTALKFVKNDMEGLDKRLNEALNSESLRDYIAMKGFLKIQEFDYEIIGRKFLNEITVL